MYVSLLVLVGGGAYAYPAAAKWWRIQSITPSVDREITYTADVVPILEEHCYECHGDGRDKGGFSLEKREMLKRGGKTGPAVAEGNSAKSALIHRVAGITDKGPMPPSGKLLLTSEQIGILRAWIDQGIQWNEMN